ncbi:MAG: hypothetical protein HOY79_06080 [Streptomyces sp.]|nr:hypothetical protein [Streptomyces sp.]
MNHRTPSGYEPVCERRINGIPARIRTSSREDRKNSSSNTALTSWSL